MRAQILDRNIFRTKRFPQGIVSLVSGAKLTSEW